MASSWYIRRLEKQAAKRERRVQRFRAKLSRFEDQHKAGKLTRAKFEMKRKDIEAKVRVAQARLHAYRGQIGKERRKLEKGEEA